MSTSALHLLFFRTAELARENISVTGKAWIFYEQNKNMSFILNAL